MLNILLQKNDLLIVRLFEDYKLNNYVSGGGNTNNKSNNNNSINNNSNKNVKN